MSGPAALLLLAALAPREGDYVLRDFRFASGESLHELRLHYTTLGERRNPAVLILHGTTGSGRQFLAQSFAGELFGPGQLLDAGRFFVILPDGIGHGKSSKPSDGLRRRFPRYTYHDMVAAQYLLVTEHFQVKRLRLVMGTSMGGMHTWMWGARYPDFMDALLPLASAPVEIAGLNRMRRRMILDALRAEAGRAGLRTAVYSLLLMTASPAELHRRAPTREAADALFDKMVRERTERLDATDMLYAFDASRDYNPAPHLEKIRAPLTAINSADDAVNPPELGILEREIQRVKHGRYVLLPISEETRGHGTHALPQVWKEHLAELLARSGGL
jgi:homoserine O-acetyltransferase